MLKSKIVFLRDLRSMNYKLSGKVFLPFGLCEHKEVKYNLVQCDVFRVFPGRMF
jgi:hypothetical protein